MNFIHRQEVLDPNCRARSLVEFRVEQRKFRGKSQGPIARVCTATADDSEPAGARRPRVQPSTTFLPQLGLVLGLKPLQFTEGKNRKGISDRQRCRKSNSD